MAQVLPLLIFPFARASLFLAPFSFLFQGFGASVRTKNPWNSPGLFPCSCWKNNPASPYPRNFGGGRFTPKFWDPSFPLEKTKSPHPQKSWKITQKLQFGPLRDCPEGCRKNSEKWQKLRKKKKKLKNDYTFSIFLVIFRQFSGQSRVDQL